MRARFKSRAWRKFVSRRKRRWFHPGRCSNCRDWTDVKNLAGCQICEKCARHLPGHLLAIYFRPMGDGKLYTEAEAIAAGMKPEGFSPAPAPAREKTWWEKIVAKWNALKRRISPSR